MRITKFIQNLKCDGCARTVRTSLEQIDGITVLSVDPDKGTVDFNYKRLADYKLAHKRLLALGYPFVEDENSFLLKARSYVSCAVGKMRDQSAHS
ncbi:MAG: copper chaperone [Flavobacterium sp.]|nr:MAG: copper chaperone [Flavobacterium sp.]